MALFERLYKLPPKEKKYEFMVLSGTQRMIDRDLKELQEKGWTICGDVVIEKTEYSGIYSYIPLKKLI